MSQKIGLLIGTNRPEAMSLEMAGYYENKLISSGAEIIKIDLSKLPPDFAFSALYHNKGKHEDFNLFQESLDSVDKLIFFVPEYNGSFPGVLKTFIDGLRFPDSFRDKKIALVGLANGVQGNAIGLSHIGDILSYMGANVMGLRVKLGEISKHFDGKELSHPMYDQFINTQIEKFLNF